MNNILKIIEQFLPQAEQFLAGQPISISIPNETVTVAGTAIEIGGTITLKKG